MRSRKCISSIHDSPAGVGTQDPDSKATPAGKATRNSPCRVRMQRDEAPPVTATSAGLLAASLLRRKQFHITTNNIFVDYSQINYLTNKEQSRQVLLMKIIGSLSIFQPVDEDNSQNKLFYLKKKNKKSKYQHFFIDIQIVFFS